MTDWFERHEEFKRFCAEGHAWERYVAMFLMLQGLDVDFFDQGIRDRIGDRHRWKAHSDLLVGNVVIEVKSRNLPRAFTGPHDLPYETVIVDTVKGWDLKDPRPHAIVNVCRRSGCMVFLLARTQPSWTVEDRYDTVRGFTETNYEAHRSLWRPIEDLIWRIRAYNEREGGMESEEQREAAEPDEREDPEDGERSVPVQAPEWRAAEQRQLWPSLHKPEAPDSHDGPDDESGVVQDLPKLAGGR